MPNPPKDAASLDKDAARLDRAVSAFLKKAMRTLASEARKEEYSDRKWACGMSAGVVQDALSPYVSRLVEKGKELPLAKLELAIKASAPGNDEIALVLIKTGMSKVCPSMPHIMIWMVTPAYAHTLQSWEDIKAPEIWKVPTAAFYEATRVIARAKSWSDAFKQAFHMLTHVGGQQFWEAQARCPRPPLFKCRLAMGSGGFRPEDMSPGL